MCETRLAYRPLPGPRSPQVEVGTKVKQLLQAGNTDVVMENVRCGTHQVIKIPRRKLSSLLHMMCKVWFLGQLFFMVGLEVVQSVTGNCISSESAFPGEPLE